MTSVMRRSAAFTAHEKPVTGDIKMSFVNYDHLGWIYCDGRALSKTQYNLLFQVIGYTFGGSGNTFNLPPAGGRVLGSVGNPGGATGTDHAPGDSIGTETETLTIAQMPAHNHGTDASNTVPGNNLTGAAGAHDHGGSTSGIFGAPPSNIVNALETVSSGSGSIVNAGEGTHDHVITPALNHQHPIATQGGGQAHNNIQPTLFIGNTFIYSGIPTYPGFPANPASAWPFTIGLNPPLI